jgi:hypothetical protein
MDVTAMAVVSRTRRWRRSRGGADNGTQTSADRGADPGTVPAASDNADYCSRSGAKQPAAERPLAGVIGVRRSRPRPGQCRSDHAYRNPSPCLLHLQTFLAGTLGDAVSRLSHIARLPSC